MSISDYDTLVVRRLLTMRIIVVALVLGVTIFLGVVVAMEATGNALPPPERPLITYMALGWAVLMLAGSFIVPAGFMVAQRRRLAQVDYPKQLAHPETAPTDAGVAGTWLNLYQTRLILGLALLEGAGFFLVIAYMIEGRAVSLIAAVFFIMLLAARFPPRARLERWMERQRDLLAQQRTQGF